MLKDLTRKTRFEGKAKDFSISRDVREYGEKSLFNFLNSELEEELNEQIISVFVGEELLTSFTKKDYDNENVELTLKQLRKNIVSVQIIEEYITSYSYEKRTKDGELKDYKVAYNNLVSKELNITIE